MSFKSLISSVLADDKPVDPVSPVGHAGLTSTRLWVLVALAALVLWVTKGVLTEENLKLLFWASLAYIGANTITRTVQIYVNGKIQIEKVRLAWADGKLDPDEVKALETPKDD